MARLRIRKGGRQKKEGDREPSGRLARYASGDLKPVKDLGTDELRWHKDIVAGRDSFDQVVRREYGKHAAISSGFYSLAYEHTFPRSGSGHVRTISQDIPTGRTRRTYSTSFKSEFIEQCRQVGVSCSAVATSHGLNPNVLRRWIKDAADSSDAAPPAPKSAVVDVKPTFVALPMTVPTPQAPDAAQANVRIDIQRNGTTVSVLWPQLCLSDSAAWVREVLR